MTQTLSQRDVPGMTRGVIPLLVAVNASAISIGVNGASCPPNVPKAFVWQEPESGAEILGMVHPYGYPNNPGSLQPQTYHSLASILGAFPIRSSASDP